MQSIETVFEHFKQRDCGNRWQSNTCRATPTQHLFHQTSPPPNITLINNRFLTMSDDKLQQFV